MIIKEYEHSYLPGLIELMKDEGPDWESYYNSRLEQYIKALESSVVFLAFKDNIICGYIRCRNDDGFGIYIYDLLVDKKYRGCSYGKKLIEHICDTFPDDTVYVMSDVDQYYEKQGYSRVGSIFTVKN